MLYIFDWDGTISDSAAKIILCMQRAADDSGLEVLDDDAIKNIIGLGLPEAIKSLYPDASNNQKQHLTSQYSQHFVNEDQKPSSFFPGVEKTLHQLREAGHQLAVATGKSRKGLDRVLNNLNMTSFFHATRCADETASKPHPLMLEELMAEFSVPAEAAVMIGDTEYDMAMAQTAGLHRIAVSYGAHHITRLKKYDPVLCVDEFEMILTWGND